MRASSSLSLEPGSYADEQLESARLLALGSPVTGGSAESALVLNTDVWSELTPDVVSKAGTELSLGQASTNPDLAAILSGKVELNPWLQDEPLRYALIVIATNASGELALVRQEERALNVEEAGGKSLQLHGGVHARWVRLEVIAKPALHIPVWVYRVAVEGLDLGALNALTKGAFTFGLEPEPVYVAAVPGFAFPAVAISALPSSIFSDVVQDLEELLVAMKLFEVVTPHVHGRSAVECVRCIGGGYRRRRRVSGRKVGALERSTGLTRALGRTRRAVTHGCMLRRTGRLSWRRLGLGAGH